MFSIKVKETPKDRGEMLSEINAYRIDATILYDRYARKEIDVETIVKDRKISKKNALWILSLGKHILDGGSMAEFIESLKGKK